MRTGEPWQRLRRSLELCAEAGADILSIESVGGKEVHDQALMYRRFPRHRSRSRRSRSARHGVALGRDRLHLLGAPGVVPGADSACGFANTAMQLAHQKMLPEVLAAVVRAMSAVRSLAAFEQGAVGPSKDCAYEGPVIKAITGRPISMEGKSASCAHFSPVGNIAAAMCDLWSNESVQNVRLLSGNAPEAFTELLAYDCRLMNAAAAAMAARCSARLDDRIRRVAQPAGRGALARRNHPHRRAPSSPRILPTGRPSPQAALLVGYSQGRSCRGKTASFAQRAAVARVASTPRSKNCPPNEATLIASLEDQYGALYDKASYGL